MIKYKTRSWAGYDIEPVEIESETVFFVTLKGETRKTAKTSEYANYHDTWEAAREYLLKIQRKKYAEGEAMMKAAHAEMQRINAM